jgi:hypothetical protein
MTEPSLDNPEFIRTIHSEEILPWSQAFFTAGQIEYRYSGGWIFPAQEGEKQATLDWARCNRFSDLSTLSELTWIPGPEQWYGKGESRLEAMASSERFFEHARAVFGPTMNSEPLHDPWFNSTVIGSCLEKETGRIRLCVIQFSAPPPSVVEIHRIGDFEFLPSPFAVTFEEWRRQRQLAYETGAGREMINLQEEGEDTYSQMTAPFYTWPKEGPIPMLSVDEAKHRRLVPSSHEYAEVILFFAWF